MKIFDNHEGRSVLLRMVYAIQENKTYLGDVDGLIGDGDHGANMNKGFTLFETRLGDKPVSLSDGLNELGMVLLNEIGGSMGPIYGTVFMEMGDAVPESGQISLADFAGMLEAGLSGLWEIVEAQPGDKTLIDTLYPAAESLKVSLKSGEEFDTALSGMQEAAEKGRDSTIDMAAKFGRSSRLLERSRGVLDAGAASCCVILCAMADAIKELLH